MSYAIFRYSLSFFVAIVALVGIGRNTKLATTEDYAVSTPSATPIGGGTGKIVFTSERDGNSEIYVMEADGSNQVRLTNNNTEDWGPTWSPDGKRIVYSSNLDESVDIYVTSSDGSKTVNLTENNADDYSPSWSPDGRLIAYQAFDGLIDKVYVVDVNSKSYLTANSGDNDYIIFMVTRQ
jgi:Tol biopolymer transport system component